MKDDYAHRFTSTAICSLRAATANGRVTQQTTPHPTHAHTHTHTLFLDCAVLATSFQL